MFNASKDDENLLVLQKRHRFNHFLYFQRKMDTERQIIERGPTPAYRHCSRIRAWAPGSPRIRPRTEQGLDQIATDALGI